MRWTDLQDDHMMLWAASAPAALVAGAGSLTANGTSLLPIGTGGDLSRYTGQAAAARAVLVLSSPADNGFWVGTSTADEV